MTHYIPSNKKDEDEILKELQLQSFEELITIIPKNLRIKDNILGLESGISEVELDQYISQMKKLNLSNTICFSGGGVYDHYVPKIIDFIASRSEFNTAYTPYQPEVSQGTLQYIYEFQSMICELSGLDIANASLYDGGSALAEACSLSIAHTRNKKILISDNVNPNYLEVTKTYLKYRDAEIIVIPSTDGLTDFDKIKEIDLNEVACIAIQSPNYLGYIEDWTRCVDLTKDFKTLVIAVGDPSTLSILESPGALGCDIYVGEGQSLGNYLSYGGPNLGLFAIKDSLKRKLPGRVVGMTTDSNNKKGFVLTLQTREQHIRRSKATSNICTNQGLVALRSVIYMSLLGKEGLPNLSKICFDKAHYAAENIKKIDGFNLYKSKNNFIKEFTVQTKFSAKNIKKDAEKSGYLIDCIGNDLIRLSFTEKRTKEEIDSLLNFLKNYEK
jgi:glycine dehydrogenase subunit 1